MLLKLVFVAVLAVGVLGRSIDQRKVFPFDQFATVYCKASNAEDKTQEVKESMMAFAECIKDLFDVNAVKAQFEEAMRTKVYDQLFKNECTKVPQFKTCLHGLVTGMSPCLPPSIRSTGSKDWDTMLDFVCENDAAKLKSFLKNDGPQCVIEQQMVIKTCSDSMKANITRLVGELGPGALSKILDEERCNLTEPATECMITALKQCSNPTPGNLAEELHKKTPCRKETSIQEKTEDPQAGEEHQ